MTFHNAKGPAEGCIPRTEPYTDEAALPARSSCQDSDSSPEAQRLLLVVTRDRTNGHFRLVRTVLGCDGGFVPVNSYLDEGGAVRAGLQEAERTGTRFAGVLQ